MGAMPICNASASSGFGSVLSAPPLAIQQSTNLVIRGLPLDCDEGKIQAIFGPYGTVIGCSMLPDDARGRVAVLSFAQLSQASWICSNLNGNIPVGLTTAIGVEYAQV